MISRALAMKRTIFTVLSVATNMPLAIILEAPLKQLMVIGAAQEQRVWSSPPPARGFCTRVTELRQTMQHKMSKMYNAEDMEFDSDGKCCT